MREIISKIGRSLKNNPSKWEFNINIYYPSLSYINKDFYCTISQSGFIGIPIDQNVDCISIKDSLLELDIEEKKYISKLFNDIVTPKRKLALEKQEKEKKIKLVKNLKEALTEFNK